MQAPEGGGLSGLAVGEVCKAVKGFFQKHNGPYTLLHKRQSLQIAFMLYSQ
jgi:hypothetical protein